MFTEFVYVRHGETDANRDGFLQGGKVDMPLNENGLKQAEAVALRLQDECFDFAFSSPMSRAKQTMEAIASINKQGISPVYDRSLCEWHCGKMDGMYFEDIKKTYPDEALAFSFERIEIQMPDGESGYEVQKRVDDFLTSVLEKHPGKRILLVAHGGVLQRVMRFVTGAIAPHNMLPLTDNASISTFRFNHQYNAWQLTSLNRNEHLKGLPVHQTRVS